MEGHGKPAFPNAVGHQRQVRTFWHWYYQFAIIDAVPSSPVAFTDLDATFIKGFALNPSSGPRELRFSGRLPSGLVAEAAFHLTVPDPGEGNSYTFTLIQGPAVTIPEPTALGLAGVGLLGLGFLRRREA